MITIDAHEKISEEVKEFLIAAWEVEDNIHFGKPVIWKKEKQVLVARKSDEIVGVLELEVQAGVMHIDELIVKHDQQGQGIGSKLMQKAEEMAKERHLHKIYLETGKGWEANAFYASLGYSIEGTHKKHFSGIDYIIFAKFF